MDRRVEAGVSSKRELMREAETLANQLYRDSVTRTELEQVSSVLFYSTGSWSDRLERARQLTRALPSSWVREWSKQMPRRLKALETLVLPVLDKHPSEPDLRFVLGWTSRLLHIAEKQGKA